MNAITDIAFEQIDGVYHWSRYGDFKVIIKITDGYINATHLCGLAAAETGKSRLFADWSRQSSNRELIDIVKSSMGIPIDDLLQVVTGGQIVELRGTYVHPLLVPHIASWASPKFAIKVSRIVNEQIVREYRESIRAKDTQIDGLIAETKMQSMHIRELLDIAKEAK